MGRRPRRASNQSSTFIFFVLPRPSLLPLGKLKATRKSLLCENPAILFICGIADAVVVRKWDFCRRRCGKSNRLLWPRRVKFLSCYLSPRLTTYHPLHRIPQCRLCHILRDQFSSHCLLPIYVDVIRFFPSPIPV